MWRFLLFGCFITACGGHRTSSATSTSLRTIDVDGRPRSFYIYVPAAAATRAYIYLHGGGVSAEQPGLDQADKTGFNQLAERDGVIMVYPNGSTREDMLGRAVATWNPSPDLSNTDADDVAFLERLVEFLKSEKGVDSVYLGGISRGGMMAYTFACQRAELIAGLGVVATTMVTPDCRPSRPVPLIHIHGDADDSVPLDGNAALPAVDAVVEFWRTQNQCSADTALTTFNDGEQRTYQCPSNQETALVTVHGGGHRMPALGEIEPQPYVVGAAMIWGFLLH